MNVLVVPVVLPNLELFYKIIIVFYIMLRITVCILQFSSKFLCKICICSQYCEDQDALFGQLRVTSNAHVFKLNIYVV